MEVTGKIIKVLPTETGVSKEGKEWSKLQFVLDNNEKYNNIFCFEVFGTEKVEQFNKYNKEGQYVKVDFNVSTNEWNGKYYTSLQAWRIFKAEVEQGAQVIDQVFPPADNLNTNDQDDLPF